MARRAVGGLMALLGLWACGSGDGSDSDAAREAGATSAPGEAASEQDVAPVARYQFVSTPDGMAVEALTDTQVQTFSCPTRTCAGLCDECAARACRSAGELGGACDLLVASCNDSCNCQGGLENGSASCGFPVCTVDRMLCYVDDDAHKPGGAPSGPGDPAPFDSAARPSSNISRPAF